MDSAELTRILCSVNMWLVIMNATLRTSDSEMLEECERSGQPCMLLLLVRSDNKHKMNVDLRIAQSLPVASRIHIVPVLEQDRLDKSAIAGLVGKSVQRILCQNIIEVAGIGKQLALLTKCELTLFEDCVCVPESLYSPVYSVFRDRVMNKVRNPRGAVRLDKIKTVVCKDIVRVSQVEPTGQDIPSTNVIVQRGLELIDKGYSDTRNLFGDLFSYDPPTTTFWSLYISAGAVTVAQLFKLVHNKELKSELLWNQFCIGFVKHYGEGAIAEYGAYSRKQKWLTPEQSNALVQKIVNMETDEPLINAIYNQLVQTGFVSNRLRMVFANYLSQKRLPWLVAKQAFDHHLIDLF